jgi:hypothetical protein
MFAVVIALAIAAVIGYTAQVTGLCMVRGVSDWVRGRRLRLTAILMAGFWIYLFTPLIAYHDRSFLAVYPFHWSIPLGGFLFGIGSAINGACSISTATRLSSGDLRMLLTMFGWLAGWLLLIVADIEPDLRSTPYQLGLLPWFSVSSLLMGVGAALALGGNDVQLLLALPALSPASLSALTGMLAGIWLGARLTGTGQSVTTRNGPSIER